MPKGESILLERLEYTLFICEEEFNHFKSLSIFLYFYHLSKRCVTIIKKERMRKSIIVKWCWWWQWMTNVKHILNRLNCNFCPYILSFYGFWSPHFKNRDFGPFFKFRVGFWSLFRTKIQHKNLRNDQKYGFLNRGTKT